MTAPHPAIAPRPGILDIAPYVGGESGAPGANRAIKLSANENPRGPSPAAVEAYRACAAGLALYPDGGAESLRAAIGAAEGLDPARIVCGAGSDEIISLLCQAYAGPGDEVLHSRHGFLMYAISAKAAGATPVAAPETELTADVDALLAACTPRTRLVFLANPNNPTGTLVSQAEVARLAEGLPPQALLVLDAAYAEYVAAPGYDAGAALADARDNVVMTRTFSKIHGLAALRLGWAYGPTHVIDVLNRVRGPFNVSVPAIAAGAAAIADREHVAAEAARNAAWRDWLAGRLAAAGVPCTRAHGNFLLARFGETGPASAPEADGWLKTRGLIVRRMEGYGLAGWLRISIGEEAACRMVADAVDAFRAARA
ncbi:MAG: histidinol-phosphate transaminase [Rubrimonas sp.]|uniref:histidinol-phosphate transaminase n=1 Tax=Rubrimonas sp. TaxID=2036015 RepID=UPI002FDDCB55